MSDSARQATRGTRRTQPGGVSERVAAGARTPSRTGIFARSSGPGSSEKEKPCQRVHWQGSTSLTGRAAPPPAPRGAIRGAIALTTTGLTPKLARAEITIIATSLGCGSVL